MIAGVSTSCFYPELTETAFDFLVDRGVKAVEIFLNCQLETTKEFLLPLKKKADALGVKIVSLHPYTSGEEGRYFFGLYPRRVEESREIYKMYYEACNIVGADSLVFHGDRFFTISDEEYIERVGKIQQDAASFGVHLTLENVWRFRNSHLDLYPKLRKALPDIKFVLDIKQAVLMGHTPEDYVKAMGGENIHHIHLSDNNKESSCLAPGKGTFDYVTFMEMLKANHFDGPLLLELYRDNYGEYEELITCYEYMKTFIGQ